MESLELLIQIISFHTLNLRNQISPHILEVSLREIVQNAQRTFVFRYTN